MNPEAGIPIAPGVTAPPASFRFQYSRGSGPGGQNVNKLNTRCELWVNVGSISDMTDAVRDRLRQFAGKRLTQLDEVHLASDKHRTQERNREEVIVRFREL